MSDETPALDTIGAISLFVGDVARAKAWYSTVLQLPVVFEDDVSAVIKFENTLLNLLLRSTAHDMIAPAVVAAPNAGAHLQFTIWVKDADDACAELQARGVSLLNGPIDRPWGQRTACFADPDGYVWEIAQRL